MEEEQEHSINNVEEDKGKGKAKFYVYIGDFFNTLKAFIGTNYLSLPYAFKQSGLIFGIVGVFIIATLTDHCCQLLIKCKYVVIDKLVEKEVQEKQLNMVERKKFRSELEGSMGYGDVGKAALGKWCHVATQISVAFTQYFTCVAYVIFVGNTIYEIFPLALKEFPLDNSSILNQDYAKPMTYKDVNPALGIPMLKMAGLENHLHPDGLVRPQDIKTHSRHKRDSWDTFVLNSNNYNGYNTGDQISNDTIKTYTTLDGVPTAQSLVTHASMAYDNVTTARYNTTTTESTNITTAAPNTTVIPPLPTPHYIKESTAPDMRYLCLIPLPFWLATTMLRKMRMLAPFTVAATICLFGGAVSVVAFLSTGFTIDNDISYYKFLSLPLFLGQLIGAYEGIGCLLPIESSMEGNRKAFPKFIHSSIYIVCVILTTFGALGYMRYGEDVAQIIVLSIPQHTVLAIAVDVTLIVSVLLTYPLQCFPCIQIFEGALFGVGSWCGPKEPDHPIEELDQPREGLLRQESTLEDSVAEVAVVIPQSVPAWKRNVFRVLITLSIMVLGVLCRNVYAFLNAFIGAFGSSLLAFILPCLIHTKLHYGISSNWVIVKDITIILLSTIASILVLVLIFIEIIEHKIQF